MGNQLWHCLLTALERHASLHKAYKNSASRGWKDNTEEPRKRKHLIFEDQTTAMAGYGLFKDWEGGKPSFICESSREHGAQPCCGRWDSWELRGHRWEGRTTWVTLWHVFATQHLRETKHRKLSSCRWRNLTLTGTWSSHGPPHSPLISWRGNRRGNKQPRWFLEHADYHFLKQGTEGPKADPLLNIITTNMEKLASDGKVRVDTAAMTMTK